MASAAFYVLHVWTIPASAQVSSPISFKDCLDKQKELREESESYFKKANEVASAYMQTVDAFRTGHWGDEETHGLMDKADELLNAADALHCVWHPDPSAVTDADKLKQLNDMNSKLLDKAILDPNIRDYLQDRFKDITDANNAAFKLLEDTGLAIQDNADMQSLNSNDQGASDTYTTMIESDLQAEDAEATPCTSPIPTATTSTAGKFYFSSRSERSCQKITFAQLQFTAGS